MLWNHHFGILKCSFSCFFRMQNKVSRWKIFIMQIDIFFFFFLFHFSLHFLSSNRSPQSAFHFFISICATAVCSSTWTVKIWCKHTLNWAWWKTYEKLPTFAAMSSTSSKFQTRKQFVVKWQTEKRLAQRNEKTTASQLLIKRSPWKFRIIIGVKLIIKRTNQSRVFLSLFFFLFQIVWWKPNEASCEKRFTIKTLFFFFFCYCSFRLRMFHFFPKMSSSISEVMNENLPRCCREISGLEATLKTKPRSNKIKWKNIKKDFNVILGWWTLSPSAISAAL